MIKPNSAVSGLAGFILGVVLTGVAVGALQHSALTSPPSDKTEVQAAIKNGDASRVLPQRIVVPFVKTDEVEAAINSFPVGAQRKIRKEVAAGKYGLAWLTIWDWDTAPGEIGNTISISTNDYRRYVILNERRSRIAIPIPRSGYIEVRGEVSEDDNISISLLSGTTPIALPVMSPGQVVKLALEVTEPLAVSAKARTTFSAEAVPSTEY